MEPPEVIVDEFGVLTVVLSLQDLQDFPKFIQYIVDNDIGEKQGIFKIRIRGSFNKENAEAVLEKVRNALNLHSCDKKKKQSKSSSFQPQKQCFFPVSKEDNVFVYRLQGTSQNEREAFKSQFCEFDLSAENSTCCTGKLQSGRTELLNHYWSNIRSSDSSVMYGAGVTIKPKNTADAVEVVKGFSLSHLNTCLKFMTTFLSGISWPHFFLGLIHASFAWHIEDAALWSILYLHLGAPKVWFAVPAAYYGALENVMYRLGFPDAYKQCRNIVGHKCFIVDPFILIRLGIPVYMVVQEEGEFVVTRPFAAHSGFNCGLNIGEAANFASPEWVPLGMIAPTCRCYKTIVNLNLTPIIKNCRPELLESYKTGNYHEAFPVASDPYSCGISSQPASSVGILGKSSEPVQFLCRMKKELDNDEEEPSVSGAYDVKPESSEIIKLEDSSDEEVYEFVDENLQKPAPLLECPACLKTYAGGFPKIQRPIQHALKYHLETNPDIEEVIKKQYVPPEKILKTKRGQACLHCGKFIRGSSTHAKVHMTRCKKK